MGRKTLNQTKQSHTDESKGQWWRADGLILSAPTISWLRSFRCEEVKYDKTLEAYTG